MNYKRLEALLYLWIHAMLYFKNVQPQNDVINFPSNFAELNMAAREKFEIPK